VIGVVARGGDVDGAILILPIQIQFFIESNLSEVPWGGCAGGPTMIEPRLSSLVSWVGVTVGGVAGSLVGMLVVGGVATVGWVGRLLYGSLKTCVCSNQLSTSILSTAVVTPKISGGRSSREALQTAAYIHSLLLALITSTT
jgi:hypothetical protein